MTTGMWCLIMKVNTRKLGQMGNIYCNIFSIAFSWLNSLIKISLSFVSKVPIDNQFRNEAYHKKAHYFEFIHVRWGSGKTKYVPIPYLHGWIARVNMCCTSMAIWTIYMYLWPWSHLTHWGRVTHICVGNLTIIGSDNGLSLGRRQTIILTNAGILSIGPLRNKLQWNFNRNSNIFIPENAHEKVVCEMASILSRPQCVKDCLWPFLLGRLARDWLSAHWKPMGV